MRYTNIHSPTSHTFQEYAHATNNSYQTENRQRNGTLLVGVLYCVNIITTILDFFFVLFLKVAIRQMKEKPQMQDGSSPNVEPVFGHRGWS